MICSLYRILVKETSVIGVLKPGNSGKYCTWEISRNIVPGKYCEILYLGNIAKYCIWEILYLGNIGPRAVFEATHLASLRLAC